MGNYISKPFMIQPTHLPPLEVDKFFFFSFEEKKSDKLRICNEKYCIRGYASCHKYNNCGKVIYFTRGHIDTYLWWNRSPNYRILFFACFTNSSRSPLWNTSKLQERLLESLPISTL